jgi:hypothetical protein
MLPRPHAQSEILRYLTRGRRFLADVEERRAVLRRSSTMHLVV